MIFDLLSSLTAKASKLDMLGRLALFYLALKLIKSLKAMSNPKTLQPRTQLALGDVDGHPHAHAYYRHFIPSADRDLWLFTKWWLPPADAKAWKGVFFIVHGFNEHISRYEHVGRYLAKQGYAVFGMDHQGHGLSEGEPLYVERFTNYIDDLRQFMHHVLSLESGSEYAKHTDMRIPEGTVVKQLPRFVLGHSMGVVITVLTVQASPEIDWTGVILSAGAIKVDPVTAPWHLRALARLLSSALPKLRFPDAGFPHLSNNPLIYQRALRDPLCHKLGLSPRWAHEFFTSCDLAMAEAPKFKHDVLLFHGTKDVIAFPSGSQEFYANAASTNKTLHMLEGREHELLNEDDHEEMLETIVDWCTKQALANGGAVAKA
ncbi:monoglyceride lipase [Achlya hypogyna]|uniref:Monoglyceride lipase n=1 Tax=Achlya hypogyna TaxID=1202772 RepID=A0A1V9Z8B2_ACHHY|nr:monoglyceride lipase [Achlya hypogyna]